MRSLSPSPDHSWAAPLLVLESIPDGCAVLGVRVEYGLAERDDPIRGLLGDDRVTVELSPERDEHHVIDLAVWLAVRVPVGVEQVADVGVPDVVKLGVPVVGDEGVLVFRRAPRT